MKKFISFLFFCLFFYVITAQTSTNTYWIRFKDKNENLFLLNNPSAYLSAKAIERRQKQNIAITSSDLPVNASYINQIKELDLRIVNQSKWFNAITIVCGDINKIITIEKLPFVLEVKAVTSSDQKTLSKFTAESNFVAVEGERADPSSRTPALNYGLAYNQAHQINADCLHNFGFKGQGITIAVLDAGFLDANTLPAFDSLRLNNQLLGTRDFITGDTMVFEDFSHGMNVLSCMGANLPGQMIGTAPKANYWLLRTEDAASESIAEEITWAVGAEFADSVGADIINSSLGYNFFDNTADNHSYADMDGNTTIVTKAADIAASKGMVVVSSAGNSAGPPWYKITAPADADSILTVGAVDSTGMIASLSSRGLTFDGRIKPDVVARGLQAVIAVNGGSISTSSGTSFSSPIIAGAVACLWQANPTATNMQIIDAVRQTASQFNTPDSIKGYGIPDFCAASTLLTGIEKYVLSGGQLNVHPNPFQDNFNVTFYSDKQQSVAIELYDISGHRITKQQKNVSNNSYTTFQPFETNALSNGLYILHFIASDKEYYRKLIKNK